MKPYLFSNSNFKLIHDQFTFTYLVFSAKQGDLQLALDLEGCLTEPQAIHVTQQVLEAVVFLHENKVVHLDIKVLNRFISLIIIDCFSFE